MKPAIKKVNNNNANFFLGVPTLIYGKGAVPLSADSFTTSLRFMPLANPLLEHLKFANFVAFDGDKAVGRITACIDTLNPRPEEGFWGCFESIDSHEVAQALLDAAGGWLKGQNKTVMIGPATLNTTQQVGLLIKGFEYEPQYEIPYNPPYYQKIVEKAGLTKIHDLESYSWQIPDLYPQTKNANEEITDLSIRYIDYGNISEEAQIIKEINNRAMSEIWGFIPMTLNDAQGFVRNLASEVPPQFVAIAEVDRKPAAMMLAIPYKKPYSNGTGGILRLAIGGVVPEVRHKGIHWIVLEKFLKQCEKLGYAEGEISQVAESNHVFKRKVAKHVFGGRIIKIHRVYKKDL